MNGCGKMGIIKNEQVEKIQLFLLKMSRQTKLESHSTFL